MLYKYIPAVTYIHGGLYTCAVYISWFPLWQNSVEVKSRIWGNRPMAKKQKQWARRARARLVHILGSRCAACGTDEALTFDCIRPCGDSHHRYSTDQRMSFYRRQARFGNVQLLCHACNSLKGELDIVTWNTALQMAHLRVRRPRPLPTPVQETRSVSRVFRSHVADVLNALVEVAGHEPF